LRRDAAINRQILRNAVSGAGGCIRTDGVAPNQQASGIPIESVTVSAPFAILRAAGAAFAFPPLRPMA
jgi:hypothetical protein